MSNTENRETNPTPEELGMTVEQSSVERSGSMQPIPIEKAFKMPNGTVHQRGRIQTGRVDTTIQTLK